MCMWICASRHDPLYKCTYMLHQFWMNRRVHLSSPRYMKYLETCASWWRTWTTVRSQASTSSGGTGRRRNKKASLNGRNVTDLLDVNSFKPHYVTRPLVPHTHFNVMWSSLTAGFMPLCCRCSVITDIHPQVVACCKSLTNCEFYQVISLLSLQWRLNIAFLDWNGIWRILWISISMISFTWLWC